jgi:hypothetical protein
MPHIPRDIWLCIAEFLPDSVLRDLFDLNPVFLHFAISIRYREVTLGDLGNPVTVRKLIRLQ